MEADTDVHVARDPAKGGKGGKAKAPVPVMDGAVPSPPGLRWDTALTLGTTVDADVVESHAATAQAGGALARAVASCPTRAGAEAWATVECALFTLTRHWWQLLLALGPLACGCRE